MLRDANGKRTCWCFVNFDCEPWEDEDDEDDDDDDDDDEDEDEDEDEDDDDEDEDEDDDDEDEDDDEEECDDDDDGWWLMVDGWFTLMVVGIYPYLWSSRVYMIYMPLTQSIRCFLRSGWLSGSRNFQKPSRCQLLLHTTS